MYREKPPPQVEEKEESAEDDLRNGRWKKHDTIQEYLFPSDTPEEPPAPPEPRVRTETKIVTKFKEVQDPALLKQIESLKAKNDALEKQLDSAMSIVELHKLCENEKTLLKAEHEATRAKLSECSRIRNGLETEVERLKRLLKDQEKSGMQLQRNLSKAEESLSPRSNREVDDLRKRLKQALTDLEAKGQELKQCQA